MSPPKKATQPLPVTRHGLPLVQDGVRKLLHPLRQALHMLRHHSPELRSERQVAYHAAIALKQYVATHLALRVQHLRRRIAGSEQVGAKGGRWG